MVILRITKGGLVNEVNMALVIGGIEMRGLVKAVSMATGLADLACLEPSNFNP